MALAGGEDYLGWTAGDIEQVLIHVFMCIHVYNLSNKIHHWVRVAGI